MYSKFGDLVFINLATKEINRKPCPESIIKKFLGGRGLATYLLLNYLDKDVGAFDAENIMVFANGVLTGTEMICSSRLHVCTRSPLSGYIATSNGGGYSANELRRCNIAALIVTGKSDTPIFINIKDEKISILDANNIWGLKTEETDKKIKEVLKDKDTKVIAIGPAGESLCRFSLIMTGIGHFAGRTGTGAVMGSKNLKAIAVKASKKMKNEKNPVAMKSIKEYISKLKKSTFYEKYSTIGSTYLVTWADARGAGAAFNYRDVKFDNVEKTAIASRKDIIIKNKGCYKCPIKCKADIKVEEGRHKGVIMERPDFEPMVSWGLKCGNEDGKESIYFHNLCNDYGVDSIDAGNIIAFVMDLYDRGIITKEDTENLDLSWGNIKSMEELLTQILEQNTWLGKTLSNGIKEAVKIIGKGSEQYAFTVKGLTMTAMDPRGFKATALGYAVSARGCDYTYVYAKPEYCITQEEALKTYGTKKAADRLSEEGKALMVRNCIIATAVVDAAGLCKIPQNSLLVDSEMKIITDVINNISGLDFNREELFKIGERIINLERIFSYKFGATAEDDKLPEKFIKEPINHGISKGSVVHLDKMIKEYYELMGWNEDGSVSEEKIKELELDQMLISEY